MAYFLVVIFNHKNPRNSTWYCMINHYLIKIRCEILNWSTFTWTALVGSSTTVLGEGLKVDIKVYVHHSLKSIIFASMIFNGLKCCRNTKIDEFEDQTDL